MCIHYSVAAAEDATVSKYAVCCPRELALHVHARFVGAERMTRTHESVSQTWIVDVFSNGRNASEWNPLAHGFVSPLNGPCVHNIHRARTSFHGTLSVLLLTSSCMSCESTQRSLREENETTFAIHGK